MNTVRSTISMSVDGYITGPDDNHDHPLGVEGERLHDWMFDPESAANEINAHVRREMSEGIGAVVIGRCMFDLGWEPWGRANPFGAPLVVTTHREDEPIEAEEQTADHVRHRRPRCRTGPGTTRGRGS